MADGEPGGSPGWPPTTAEFPGPPRRHLVLVLVLVLVAVGAIGAGVSVLFRPNPGSSVAVDEASEAAEPSRGDRGRPVNLRALAKQVADIRGLPLKRKLRARVLSARSLAAKVSDLAFSENDPKTVEADQRLLIALRLAPPDIDLERVLEDLYREQILGLYVPEERTLYIKGGADRGSAAQRLTSAHEITHALQDQHYDLVKLQGDATKDTDAALARVSLIEGDAVITQELWSQRHQTAQERQDAIAESQTDGGAVSRAPAYLRESLFFPYREGSAFVAELYRGGGFAAVDAAFADPPTTTEQILHPEKYHAGEDAIAATVEGRPGPRWKRSATYPFGEFDVEQLFSNLGGDQAAIAAEGWGGGEIRSWVRGDRTAVGAVLAFDSTTDAAEGCDAMKRWYATAAQGRPSGDNAYTGDRDHLVLRCSATQLRFGLADDIALARRLSALE